MSLLLSPSMPTFLTHFLNLEFVRIAIQGLLASGTLLPQFSHLNVLKHKLLMCGQGILHWDSF